MKTIIIDGIEYNLTPKVLFKKGDWIVFNGLILYIKEVVKGYYRTISRGGIPNSYDWNIDNIARLWTIQDAKDGDVLIDKSGSRECPFIFKETKPSDIKTDCLNPLTVLGYCGIGGAGFAKSEGWGDTANCTYYPATKEQREQLEKAMADAGYTFDFNKKEVKNVKPQSSTPMSYGKELEERMYEACNRFNAPNTDPNRYSAADLFYAGVKAERDLNTHAWSEEDERILVEMLKIFNIENFEGYKIGEYNEDALKFLKSLKGRVQPKQELSE